MNGRKTETARRRRRWPIVAGGAISGLLVWAGGAGQRRHFSPEPFAERRFPVPVVLPLLLLISLGAFAGYAASLLLVRSTR